METVNNVAASAQSAATSAYTTASKLIFGEGQNPNSGEEPISGEQGAGTTGEPFDQGNKYDGAAAGEPSTDSGRDGSLAPWQKSGQEALSGEQGKGTLTEPFDKGNEQDGSAANPNAQDLTVAPIAEATGISGGDSLPSATSGNQIAESTLQFPNDRDADKVRNEPSGGQQDIAKASNEAPRDAISKGVPISGPGGSAGGNDLSGEAIKAQADEKYKSTGVAAEGGDFDATKPGAGAEASRLLEEKEKKEAGATIGSDSGNTKPKLSERIKEKLHISKH